jgi:pyridoxamine 5'-phosphate oxidase
MKAWQMTSQPASFELKQAGLMQSSVAWQSMNRSWRVGSRRLLRWIAYSGWPSTKVATGGPWNTLFRSDSSPDYPDEGNDPGLSYLGIDQTVPIFLSGAAILTMTTLFPPLNEHEAPPHPWGLFREWYDAARPLHPPEPDAMTLATVGVDGRPSARIVLLKQFDEDGLVFHTHYESRKGAELSHNPSAALLFYWPVQLRQVRIEGGVERIDPAESDAYFRTRPQGSQIGAWASPQSRVLQGREELDARIDRFTRDFADREIPRPPGWGGYRLLPLRFEFWQARIDRLHDRLLYQRRPDQTWSLKRLAP